MNEFQRLCQQSVEDFLKKIGVSAKFEFKNEAGDSFWVAKFKRGEDDLEIFIYADEVGFFVNRVWHIHERQDFDAPQQLIASFLRDLARVLGGSDGGFGTP